MKALRNRLIAKLHIAKKQLGLDEEIYRDALELATGARSAKAMTDAQLVAALEHFKTKGFDDKSKTVAPATPYLRKLQALWVSAWNLGLVRDRRDSAMEAFVQRQTGLASARWLVDHAAAKKAIEALKDWMAREAQVDWNMGRRKHAPGYYNLPAFQVCAAQWRLLQKAGLRFHVSADASCDVEAYGRKILGGNVAEWPNATWARLTRIFGAEIRAARKAKKRAA
jgi:phage gp16-like protein